MTGFVLKPLRLVVGRFNNGPHEKTGVKDIVGAQTEAPVSDIDDEELRMMMIGWNKVSMYDDIG